jgi:hypothetical protein
MTIYQTYQAWRTKRREAKAKLLRGELAFYQQFKYHEPYSPKRYVEHIHREITKRERKLLRLERLSEHSSKTNRE